MAGDSSIIIPVQRPEPTVASGPPPDVRLRRDAHIDTGISSVDPNDFIGDRMFNGGIDGLIARSGGTGQQLQINAPVAPELNTTSISTAVPRAASTVINSADRTMNNFEGALQSGATQVLRGQRALDRAAPIGTVGLDVFDAAGRGLISITPRNAGLASGVVATNRAITSLIPNQANFSTAIDHPIVYDDKHGTRMLLQPGSTLVGQNGVVRLISNGGYITSNGVTVAAGHTDITVGKNGQKFLMDRFYVQDGKTSVDMRGIQTILGSDGSLISRADSINVDLPHATVRVSGAQIASPDAHTLSAGLDQLAVRSGNTSVTAGSTSITSTTNGPQSTLAAMTNQLDVVSGHTSFSVDNMTLSLSRNTASNTGALKWSVQGLHLDDGTNKINAPAAELGLVKRADGSSVLGVRTRDLAATLGNQNWVTKGPTTLALSFDSKGMLTDVSAKAADVSMADATNQLHAQGTYLHAAVGANGQIASIDGGSNHFDLAMQGRTLTLNNSRLDVTRDGGAVVLKGTALNGHYSDNSGTYNLGRNGSIEARITQDAVHITGSASQFDWANKQSALAFTNGRIDAAFGPGVAQEYMRFDADHVSYTGMGSSNQVANVVADNAVANLTRDQNGSLALNLAGKNVGATIGGAQLGFTDVKSVDVIANSAGKITHIDAIMPGDRRTSAPTDETLSRSTIYRRTTPIPISSAYVCRSIMAK